MVEDAGNISSAEIVLREQIEQLAALKHSGRLKKNFDVVSLKGSSDGALFATCYLPDSLQHVELMNTFLEDPNKTLNDHGCMDPQSILESSTVSKSVNIDWRETWRVLAARVGASFAFLEQNGQVVQCVHRPPCVIPHLVPIWSVIASSDDVIIVSPAPSATHPLSTILRFAHRNMDIHSEATHIIVSGLLECCHQLSLRGIFPIFSPHLFISDDVPWIQCDVVAAMLSTRTKDAPQFPPITSQLQYSVHLQNETEKWRRRQITNLEYLLILNEFAGRKRGEVHNHPVVPWVCDFTSIDGGWRPLDKTKFRLQKGDDQLREMFQRQPAHHVAELLSDIGYMVYRARVETREELCRYVRRQWVPREYPLSVCRMYEWTPDECIPELYEDESLIKSIHKDMPDLELPSFIRSPAHFIDWHRSMMESEEVSAHLHEWIDLAFGYLLSGEPAVNALNVHLSYVNNEPKLVTNGVVQLFHHPHPKRCPLPSDDVSPMRLSPDDLVPMVSEMGRDADEHPSHPPLSRTLAVDGERRGKADEGENLVDIYKGLLSKHKSANATKSRCVRSLLTTVVELCLPGYCNDLSPHATLEEREKRADSLLKQQADKLPRHLQDSLPRLFSVSLSSPCSLPSLSHLHLFMLHTLSVPPEVVTLHDKLSSFYGFHIIRRHSMVAADEKHSATALHGELECVRECMQTGGSRDRECRLVRIMERLLDDETAAIATVYRLFPVVSRIFSQHSLTMLLAPLKRLLHNEGTVKLLDRRFLLQVSIAYGAHVFLEEVAPTLVEAVASRVLDRSIVAKESIMWLSKRYGPVVCARFITSNLLRILASCYVNLEIVPTHRNSQDVFSLPLEGDSSGIRVESCLADIAASYSTTFVTVQYLPFCTDLVEQASRRGVSPQMEPALISILRITRLSIRALNDSQLMNYLEDFIIDKIVTRLVGMACNGATAFSSGDVRRILAAKVVSLLLDISQRVGAENVRMHAKEPFEKLFETFSSLYEADEELKMKEKEGANGELVSSFPLWFIQSVVGRFSSEWGVPLLSSFCRQPAFLVPFVTAQASSSPSNSPYSMTGVSSGNRLFSLSSPASGHNNIIGGSGCFDSGGSLSPLWCARVSAAVCANGVRPSLRFDHLTLCSFPGHQGSIRRLASLSNENSFVSASSDKTVKLWSVRPDQEISQCQWTYKGHNRAVVDVHLMASNLIASTDGVLHVWDPFHGCTVSQLEWAGESAICCLDSLDRHTLAAASSLHSTIKIYDTRCSGWAAELRISPIAGMVRAMCIRDGRLAVALSNGTVAMMDPRTGRVSSLCHGNNTHSTGIRWLSSNSFIVSDSDDEAVVFDSDPRIQSKWRTADPVQTMTSHGDLLVSVQQSNTLRLYQSQEIVLESKMKSDLLPGAVSAITYLPLNNTFLLGSNSGAIKLMC